MPTSRPNARSSSAICSYWDARSAKSKAQVRLPGRKVAAHVGTTGQQAMGDQGCPCSDCKPLDRAIRTGVRPKMPPRTAVPRAVPGMRLVAQRALSNMQPQRAVGAPILARCNRLSSARSILGRFCSNQNMSRRSHPSLTSPHHHQQQSSTLHATQSQYSRLAVFMYDPQQAVGAPTRGYCRYCFIS